MTIPKAAAVRLVVLTAAGAACTGGPPPEGGTDARTAITLPTQQRDAVLAEMRTLLGSLNGVLRGLSEDDTAGMRSAAAASGVSTAADRALEDALPRAFLQLGMDTHQRFDTLAAAIDRRATHDTVVTLLARLTDNCVSCHATYRLAVR